MIFLKCELKIPIKIGFVTVYQVTSLVAQMVKRLPTMWETWVQSLGREDLLEKEMATHSSILAWKIPWMEEPVGYSPWGHKESDTIELLHFHFHPVMNSFLMTTASHSSILAWRIPGTGEPGGLPSMGSHRVGHN